MKPLGGLPYLATSLAVFGSQHLLLVGLLSAAHGDLSHLPWWFWFNPLRAILGPMNGTAQPMLAAALGMVMTLAVDIVLVLLAFRRGKTSAGEVGRPL